MTPRNLILTLLTTAAFLGLSGSAAAANVIDIGETYVHRMSCGNGSWLEVGGWAEVGTVEVSLSCGGIGIACAASAGQACQHGAGPTPTGGEGTCTITYNGAPGDWYGYCKIESGGPSGGGLGCPHPSDQLGGRYPILEKLEDSCDSVVAAITVAGSP